MTHSTYQGVMADAEKVFQAACAEFKQNPDLIRSRRRQAPLVIERKKVAHKMREAGFSTPIIGEIMDRDHTSILYMLGRLNRPVRVSYDFKGRSK